MSEASYSFGDWLKRRRKEKNLTQKELAARAYCSINTIKKIEADQRRPSRELAESLGAALSWPEEQLEIFVECARGQRPVDHLSRISGFTSREIRPSRLSPITPDPLPEPPIPLIGRDSELVLLHNLLSESWLVTIVGIGGIGKTHLALAAAAGQQRAGQTTAFISLVKLMSGEDLASAIVEALNLRLAPGSNPAAQLLGYVKQKRMFLVLDNFEHLLERRHLLVEMHQAAPELTLLVTSRERLHLPGEQLLPLQGLSYPRDQREMSAPVASGTATGYPAAQLFLSHTRRLIPGFMPRNEQALFKLCRLTNGLPLALQLAAAWMNSMTLSDLVQELEQSLDLLTWKQPDLPLRQRSIRAVFDTTWQHLNGAERDAFARLTVFSGGFTRKAAWAVAEVSLPLLSDLVGHYLVQLERKSGRYTLHELMRQYGAEKLAVTSSTGEEIRRRHAQYFCEFLAGKEVELKNANQLAALEQVRAERANIWSAWQWAAHHPEEVPLTDAIFAFGTACYFGGWTEDGYTVFTQSADVLSNSLDLADVLPAYLHLNIWRSWFAFLLGRSEDAPLAYNRQLISKISPSFALRPIIALYHLFAAEAFLDAGDRDKARGHGEQAIGLYESLDDPWGQANALNQLGNVYWNVGAYTEARDYFEESLALHRQLGASWGIAASLDRLGLLLMHQGEYELSNQYLTNAVDLFSQIGDQAGLADALENMGSNWLEMGLLAEAHAQYLEVAALYDELGIRHLGYTILKALTAYASVHLGEYARADREAHHALALSQEYGHKRSEGLALVALGMVAAAKGHDAAADAHLTAGTNYLRAISQLDELAQGIGVQALVAYQQGRHEEASQLVSSALEIVTEIRGLLASPSYALAVWALILTEKGEYNRAGAVYQLALSEPLSAASRWFADMFGRIIAHSPPSNLMPPEERWAAIAYLYQTQL